MYVIRCTKLLQSVFSLVRYSTGQPDYVIFTQNFPLRKNEIYSRTSRIKKIRQRTSINDSSKDMQHVALCVSRKQNLSRN